MAIIEHFIREKDDGNNLYFMWKKFPAMICTERSGKKFKRDCCPKCVSKPIDEPATKRTDDFYQPEAYLRLAGAIMKGVLEEYTAEYRSFLEALSHSEEENGFCFRNLHKIYSRRGYYDILCLGQTRAKDLLFYARQKAYHEELKKHPNEWRALSESKELIEALIREKGRKHTWKKKKST